VIISGTGFDVSHPPIASKIRCCDGQLLSEKWAASPAAYLATTVPDVPNAYVLLGPNILVYKSFLALAEAQLDYAVDALVTTERAGIEVIEIRDEPFRIFNEEVQAGLAPTVLDNGGCSSYYLNARRKNCAAWPFSTGSLRRRLSRFGLQNYHAVPAADSLTFRQSPPPHNSAHGRPVLMRRCGVGGVVLVWVLGAGPSIGVGGTRGGRRRRCGCPTRRGG